MNQAKEKVCYVSTDFDSVINKARQKNKENTVVRNYALPDYANIRKGFVKTQEESSGKPINSEQVNKKLTKKNLSS